MPLGTLDQFSRDVVDLPDRPNTQMSAAQLKEWFDAAPEELRGHTNNVINVLKSTTVGDSGAENIGSANISGINGTTAHAQIKDVFTQLQSVVLGQIPNKSITREKFADGAVDFSPVQLEIANLNLQLAASQLVPSGKTYGWDPKTSFGVIVDFTKGKTTAQLNAGDTSLEGKVSMSQGTFVAGKKVTVIGRNPADDSIVKEQATITSVSPLTISPLVNSYKTGAWIKRSTANNTTNGIKFGGVDDSVIKNVTDATVTNSAQDTSGNGGRRLVQLENGWLIAIADASPNTYLHVYKPEQANPQWAQLCWIGNASKSRLSFYKNRVFVLYKQGATIKVVNIDTTSVSNVDVSSTAFQFTINSTTDSTVDNQTIEVYNNEVHVGFNKIFNSHSNSQNVGYVKGTVNAEGNISWGSVVQVTKANASTAAHTQNPSIVIKDNVVYILCESSYLYSGNTVTTNNNTILVLKNGTGLDVNANVDSAWTFKTIYNGSTYAQSSPSAIFVPQSVNGLANGRIWVAWHGNDSGSSYEAIRSAYSDDGGVTWSAMQKLTDGSFQQLNPSITASKNNKIVITWSGLNGLTNNGFYYSIKKIANTNGTWGSVVTVKEGNSTTSHLRSPSTLFDISLDFSEPLFIYKQDTAKVGFYGTWTIGVETPITENTLRLTLTQQAKEVMTYLHYTGNLTADASVNGNVMDKTTTAEETQFTKVLGSLQDIEIEITLTRASVNDDITIDKILGGVA